jgi:hypothetical protein
MSLSQSLDQLLIHLVKEFVLKCAGSFMKYVASHDCAPLLLSVTFSGQSARRLS